jgi:hyperosmotically inducible periplasmic protein
MMTKRTFRIAGAVLFALASVHAWAQPDASAVNAAPNTAAIAASSAATPQNTRAANRALRRKIYSAIVKHKEISAGDISVVAKGGAVTLNGTVVDAMQIDKVAEIAQGVPGVTSVTNKLTVKRPFGGQ